MVDLSSLFPYAFLVPLLTAIAFVIVGLFGTRLEKLEWGGWVAVGFAGAAMVVGVLIAIGEMLSRGTYTDTQYVWLSLPPNLMGTFPNGFELVMGTLVDPVSALMLIPVTVVGFLVLLYSIGYMHHDRGLPRYYAELSLFLTAMTGLVLADNLFQFFLFWELVGVCSYFLVGFYYEKPSAASAAKEAFLVTRVGDVMFMLGIFIYFYVYAVAGGAGGWAAHGFVFVNGQTPFLAGVMGGNSTLLTIAGLMILGGAAGKSAQFPLHVWLPDAMEGPTTVSALIHAATMVAAGVYLLVITSLFLGFTSTDLFAIVAIGGFTSFFAATMAVVQTDIKRVIAYSTISQLGYMVLGVGAGFAMVGMFHLFTHAFFKALLFLAAGAVIHSVGTQDLFKMGGLKRPMRITGIAFAIGGLALSGIFPFSGFWSKDDILSSVYSQLGTHPLYWPFFLCALATVYLTGYYIFRAWFLAFGGDKTRDPTIEHVHEAPWVMLVPLIVLSGFAIVSGFFVFVPQFASLLPGANIPPSYTWGGIGLTLLSLGLGGAGIATAWAMWGNGRMVELPSTSPLQSVRTLLLNRYYFKVAYDAIGLTVVYTVARAADFVDQYMIDGAVRGLEHAFSGLSERSRRMQTGIVLDYASFIVAGLVALLVVLLVLAPLILQAWGG
jgi:NADH-quinone oxidoreductase subunit L